MSNTALPLGKRIDSSDPFQESWVAISDNQLKLVSADPSSFEISDKSTPGSLIFYVSKLEGEDLFAPVIFSWSLRMSGKGSFPGIRSSN